MNHKTKILIADDHKVVIEGIKCALRGYPELEVVGEALDGRDAVRKVSALEPDIVIMDISMPYLNGIDATLQIKKLYPKIGIIILSMYSNEEYIISLIKAGISAYIVKEDPLSDIVLAINAARRHGAYFSAMVRETLLDHLRTLETSESHKDPFEELSLREREILQLLVEGKKVKDIADILNVSPKTIESHKSKIMGKLDAHSVSDLTRIAIRKRVIIV